MKTKKSPKTEKSVTGLEKINDFTLVNTLVCLGCEILMINQNKEDPQKNEFIFDKNEILERLIQAYFNGNLLVEPKKFLNIRKQIHEQVKNLA